MNIAEFERSRSTEVTPLTSVTPTGTKEGERGLIYSCHFLNLLGSEMNISALVLPAIVPVGVTEVMGLTAQ